MRYALVILATWASLATAEVVLAQQATAKRHASEKTETLCLDGGCARVTWRYEGGEE